jgi:hypothetical protein
MMPKFIRFRGDIINLNQIVDINYNESGDYTYIDYGKNGESRYNSGDHRDEIWALMKLALKPESKTMELDVTQPNLPPVVSHSSTLSHNR